MWPEPYATIVTERRKGTPDSETAAKLGLHVSTVRSRVREWNRSNPNNPIPRRKHTSTALYAQAAQMKIDGKTREEIAAIMGVTPMRVSNMWTQARSVGLLPRKPSRVQRGGMLTVKHYVDKGAAPKLGGMDRVLNTLSTAEVHQLLGLLRPEDTRVSDAVARIVKGHLRDNPKGR